MGDYRQRADIYHGQEVYIVLKKDQQSGKLTSGFVGEILTSSYYHPRGIKVRLTNGLVGRVQGFVDDD